MFLPFALGLSNLKKHLGRMSPYDNVGALPNLVREDIRSTTVHNTPEELGFGGIMRLELPMDVDVYKHKHQASGDVSHGHSEILPTPHRLKGTPIGSADEHAWFFCLHAQMFEDYDTAVAIDGLEQLEGIAERMT